MPRVRENAKLTSGNERAGKGGMGEYTVDVKFRLKKTVIIYKKKIKLRTPKTSALSSTKIEN